ncbi:hypothetical protein V6N12_011702 [Hibiscus sabdariffa]|uniref:DRBM domain-containing protein n=1 Tax=Hibiscus sabdariffa TaxID=183260 RepID=A0ABR2BT87_9ROSI
MDKSNVCPTEDAMQVFMDYLVDPLLPSNYSYRNIPSLDKQKAVANQVQAVVLLYNYYHRKIHPQLEYLGFEQFCKLALILKPNLKSHMKFMLRPDDTEVSDLEKQLSLTEKVIKDACYISTSLELDASNPSSKGWLVSKVAVLLIDSSKEKCFLQNGSITWGVWSVIEKDVNEPSLNPDGSIEVKHMEKRRRIPDKHLQAELGADEGRFQQFAFSAVKEAIHDGLSQSDVTIIESHVVFSLSKGKTTTRFYIMQFVGEKEIAHWIPIKDVIDSIQDQGSVPEVVCVNGSHMKEPCKPEVNEYQNRNQIIDGVGEAFRNTTSVEPELEMQNLENEHFSNDVLEGIDGPQNMVVNDHSVVYSEKKLTWKNVAEKVQDDAHLRMASSRAESDLHGMTNAAKLQCGVGDSELENLIHLEGQNVANKIAELNNVPSCQDGLAADNHAPVIQESNTKYLAIVQNTVSSKEHILSETALRFLLSKRDKLVLQQRAIGDEIAQCDKKIQTILSGSGDDLDLKMDLIIEGCNDVYFKSASQGRTIHDYEGQCSNSNIERNKLSDEAIGKQNPCQELDHICKEKNWPLPTYQVYSLDVHSPLSYTAMLKKQRKIDMQELTKCYFECSKGGYQAKVDVKGLNFEASSMGVACPKPPEARGSAATQMLAKLLSMSIPAD